MKLSLNVLQKFMLVFCLGVFVVGCSSDNLQSGKQSQMENHNLQTQREGITAADLEFVGIEHNAYLEVVYEGLANNDVSGEEGVEFIKSLLRNEIQNSRYTEECKALGIQLMEAELELPLDNPYVEKGNFYPSAKIAEYLSEEEKKYLDKLYVIVMEEESSLKERKEQIKILENQINSADFTDKQLITLYSATNVAKYSLTYWSANFSDWDILDGTETTTNNFWGTIGAADVGGAVGAAATCWIVNAAPGAGQVAYGGAIVGGAVGGSVAAGVTILLTKWWGD